ncbi:AraC family transcriptional regulator [Paenibacillus endoradicis]|uniref:AraC family transcriptional regulator n=1 Tax=Paenibacillus endoradicis TaxID=2972487 RepID=UPI002158D271|nr:AraC family transcriptional regulator [Paenibacillus endoradicis]MCR8658638.1 AraC family transcriptional regulator [Paenibacillus endoradicis]
MHVQSIQETLRSLSFHLLDIELMKYNTEAFHPKERVDSYTLLIIKSGSGSIYKDAVKLLFSSHSAFLLNPGNCYQIVSADNEDVQYYKVKFLITRINELSQPEVYKHELFPSRSELRVYPLSQLIDMSEQLYENKGNYEHIESFQQNLRFMKLMGFVLEHNIISERKPNSIQAIERTVQYLQDHYTDKITVKFLSQMAGYPNSQYSIMFKELTGQKPLDYLTELRIKQSKNWLLQSKESLRYIAEKVGFADEYYFNRRFRQTTGMSPRQYAKAMERQVSVKDCAGHEVAIPSKPSRVIFYGNSMQDLLPLGIEPIEGGYDGGSFNREKASLIKPDLIIFDREDEQEYKKISQIAPTLQYNSHDSLEERLLTLGKWFGKESEARQWLNHHANNSDRMWRQLQTYIKPGETASVFVYHRGKRLFVMGKIGLTSVLYHPSGFRPVDKVKDLLGEEQAYKEISLSNVQDYAGDRIFMICPSDPVSRRAMEETISSNLWKSIPAVRNGLVYLVDELTWNCVDAITISKLLNLLPTLLKHTS